MPIDPSGQPQRPPQNKPATTVNSHTTSLHDLDLAKASLEILERLTEMDRQGKALKAQGQALEEKEEEKKQIRAQAKFERDAMGARHRIHIGTTKHEKQLIDQVVAQQASVLQQLQADLRFPCLCGKDLE